MSNVYQNITFQNKLLVLKWGSLKNMAQEIEECKWVHLHEPQIYPCQEQEKICYNDSS
jgi:hypothetical protein